MTKGNLGPVRHMNRCPIHGVYPAAGAMVPCPKCQKDDRGHAAVEPYRAPRHTVIPAWCPGAVYFPRIDLSAVASAYSEPRTVYFPSFQAIAEYIEGQARAFPGGVYFPRLEPPSEIDLGPPGMVHTLYFPRLNLPDESHCGPPVPYEEEDPSHVHCGECQELVPLRPHYCGTPCRQKAYRRRKKGD